MENAINLYSDLLENPMVKTLDGRERPELVDLWKELNKQVANQITSQFGIAKLLDKTALAYETGGRVDTIHNVHHGVEIKNAKAKERLQNNKNAYDSKTAHKNQTFMAYKKKAHQEFNKGQGMIDAATGKPFLKHQKMNVDHTVSGKAMSEDPRIALAGINPEKEANQKENYATINEGVNKSKGAKSNSEYLKNNKQRVAQAKKNISKLDKNSPTYEQDKARFQGVIDANEEKLKEADQKMQDRINHDTSEKYYRGAEFRRDTAKAAGKQGIRNATQAAWGIVIYEFQQIFFDEVFPLIKNWGEYKNRHSEQIKLVVSKVKVRLKDTMKHIESELLVGMSEGFLTGIISTITTTIINVFVTTAKNLARLINDGIGGLYQGIKLLITNPEHLSKGALIKQVLGIISTAIIASCGVIFSEYLTTQLKFLGDKVSVWVANGISAIMTGVAIGLGIFAINRIDRAFIELAEDIKYATVSAASIIERYRVSISHVEVVYQKLLTEILNEYNKLGKMAQLSHDISLASGVQLESSAEYAKMSHVSEDRILRTNTDVLNYLRK